MLVPEYIVCTYPEVGLSGGIVHVLPDLMKGGITTIVHPGLDPGDLSLCTRDKCQKWYKINNLLTLNHSMQAAGRQQAEE